MVRLVANYVVGVEHNDLVGNLPFSLVVLIRHPLRCIKIFLGVLLIFAVTTVALVNPNPLLRSDNVHKALASPTTTSSESSGVPATPILALPTISLEENPITPSLKGSSETMVPTIAPTPMQTTPPTILTAPSVSPTSAQTTTTAQSEPLNNVCRDYKEFPVNTLLAPVNIGMVVQNIHDRFAEFQALFASLLELRSCPIHVHITTDEESRKLIQAELERYVDNGFSLNFHKTDRVVKALEGIKTKFSSPTALYKASPELLFPDDLDNVLVIDFDMIFIDDICGPYYQLLKDVNNTFALVGPEFVGWSAYNLQHTDIAGQLKEQHAKWSSKVAMAGMNSGTVMANLKRMRIYNWTSMFLKTIRMEPWSMKKNLFEFPDQNIYNLMSHISTEYVQSMSFGMNYMVQSHKFGLSLNDRLDDVILVHGSSGSFRSGLSGDFGKEIWWRFATDAVTEYYGQFRPDHLISFARSGEHCRIERRHIKDVIRTLGL